MYLVPYKYYNKTVQPYDYVYKNNFISFFQISKLNCLSLSFNLNFLTIKYILYSLLFLNIITLQKPALNFCNRLKINVLMKKNLFVGCKVTLRNDNMYSFLNFLIIKIFPNLKMNRLIKKPLRNSKLSYLKNFTFHINSLPNQFPEIEYFYNYFQYLNNLSITISVTKKIPKFQFLSFLYISNK